MQVTHKIKIQLDNQLMLPPIDVMQGDAYTRIMEFSLYSAEKEWPIPTEASVAIGYFGASGRGAFNSFPDGAPIYQIDGNKIMFSLIPQVTAMAGITYITVVFTDNKGWQLATFAVPVRAERNPALGAGKPQKYYNLKDWVGAGPLHIHVFGVAAEDYVADQDYGIIQQEYEAGRQVVCSLEMDDRQWLELPLVKATNGVFEFGGIVSDTGWKALISRGEDGAAIVEVTSSVYGGPPVYVTMTGTEATGYQADCTYEMIKAAHEAKRTVYCVYNTTIMTLAAVTESMVAFQTVYSKSTYRRAFIYADASQPPKTDMMKFVLAEDLEGLEAAPEVHIGPDAPTDPNVCLWVDPSEDTPEAGGGAVVDPETIKQAVDEYMAKNPVTVEETDPTVPAWAKQPNKPTYTAAEVGAMPADAVLPSGGGGSVWLQPFELMGTATLQEDCTRWIITQTDDGTTFDNKRYRAVKFITKMIPSADTSASSAKANVWLNNPDGGKNLIGENMYHSSSARTRRFYGECSNDVSYLKQLGYAAEQLREGINKFPYVKQIVIDPSTSGHKFGAGSTVEIWGVSDADL